LTYLAAAAPRDCGGAGTVREVEEDALGDGGATPRNDLENGASL
jgi:hypothetical protein